MNGLTWRIALEALVGWLGIIAICLLLVLFAGAAHAQRWGGAPVGGGFECGIPPIPPIPPAGCRDLVPICVCDQNGNCRIVFQCVPW
jgi:hypothetical protein